MYTIQIYMVDEYSGIDVLIDDKLVHESRSRSFKMDFAEPLDKVIGSDCNGNASSKMLFGILIFLPVIPAIEERWLIRTWMAPPAFFAPS